jgi:hypothetical protein
MKIHMQGDRCHFLVVRKEQPYGAAPLLCFQSLPVSKSFLFSNVYRFESCHCRANDSKAD